MSTAKSNNFAHFGAVEFDVNLLRIVCRITRHAIQEADLLIALGKIAVGWVGGHKDESIPPFDKQVYNNTGLALIEPGTECEYTKPAMVVYCERSENVKVGQYVSV